MIRYIETRLSKKESKSDMFRTLTSKKSEVLNSMTLIPRAFKKKWLCLRNDKDAHIKTSHVSPASLDEDLLTDAIGQSAGLAKMF